MPNIRYMYEGKLREIDLFAFFEEIKLHPKKGENLQYTSTSIIVECKKSTKYPWVFFSSAQYGWEDIFYFIKYYSDFDLHFAEIKAPKLRNQLHTKLKKNHYIFDKDVPYCLSYCEAFKKPDAPSEIYKAIESVLSFLKFKIESRKLRADKNGVYTQFYYPIVVLDGSLFEAEIDEDAIQVKKRDHIHLRVDFEDEIFMLDIVTKQKFEDFFNTIENDHYDFVECINKINFSQEYISSLKKYKGET